MAKKKQQVKRPSTQQDIDNALATAVAEGDIVNFRFLFVPFSPLRSDSTEDLHTDKYSYLRPRDEADTHFREALRLVGQSRVQDFVRTQLEKKGPPQLPSELLVMLADNAVRLKKYTAAAQAYEILRIRRRMQEEFYRQADEALDQGNISRGVRGYISATGLEYDYAAFPEPMPAVPNYHNRALLLHADYPMNPDESLSLQAPEQHVETALSYLLLHSEASARLAERSLELKLQFIKELVQEIDPQWQEFRERFRQSCTAAKALGERLQKSDPAGNGLVADEFEGQRNDDDPRQVSARLLGREIPQGEWWQYLKELAYEHPAAILFVARQVVGKDAEILMPRFRKDSPLAQILGLQD